MINDQDAERAADYLRDKARELALSKAEMIKSEDMLKVIRALVMGQSNEKSAAAKEAEAYASEKYQAAIDARFNATVRYEELRALCRAAEIRVEVWRSQSANHRGRI